MTFVPAIFDSQEENHTAVGQLLLTKRSDFRSAEELVRGSPFGGVEIGKRFLRVACGGSNLAPSSHSLPG